MRRWHFIIECSKPDCSPRRQRAWRMAETAEAADLMLKRDFRDKSFKGLDVKVLAGPSATPPPA